MTKVLLIDDSIDLLEVLKYFLQEKGYEVEIGSSQSDLKSLLKGFIPDVLIMDIYLHGEDGRDICKELRKESETKNLCILMFSASSKALVNYKEYGADGFIEKPFGLVEIVHKIEATLERCRNYQHD